MLPPNENESCWPLQAARRRSRVAATRSMALRARPVDIRAFREEEGLEGKPQVPLAQCKQCTGPDWRRSVTAAPASSFTVPIPSLSPPVLPVLRACAPSASPFSWSMCFGSPLETLPSWPTSWPSSLVRCRQRRRPLACGLVPSRAAGVRRGSCASAWQSSAGGIRTAGRLDRPCTASFGAGARQPGGRRGAVEWCRTLLPGHLHVSPAFGPPRGSNKPAPRCADRRASGGALQTRACAWPARRPSCASRQPRTAFRRLRRRPTSSCELRPCGIPRICV